MSKNKKWNIVDNIDIEQYEVINVFQMMFSMFCEEKIQLRFNWYKQNFHHRSLNTKKLLSYIYKRALIE